MGNYQLGSQAIGQLKGSRIGNQTLNSNQFAVLAGNNRIPPLNNGSQNQDIIAGAEQKAREARNISLMVIPNSNVSLERRNNQTYNSVEGRSSRSNNNSIILQKLPDVAGANGKVSRFRMEIGSGEIH